MLTKWLENDPKVMLVCAIVSAVSLVASITRVLASVLPFDVAWVALALTSRWRQRTPFSWVTRFATCPTSSACRTG